MRVIIVLFLSLVLFSSCSKDEDPTLEVVYTFSKSEKFTRAKIQTAYFSLFHPVKDVEIGGTSIIQQWEGHDYETDLTATTSHTVLNKNHWEGFISGVKPDLTIEVTQNGITKNVDIPYVPAIQLPTTVPIEINKDYKITIDLDTDQAIKEVNGQYQLDWTAISARLETK